MFKNLFESPKRREEATIRRLFANSARACWLVGEFATILWKNDRAVEVEHEIKGEALRGLLNGQFSGLDWTPIRQEILAQEHYLRLDDQLVAVQAEFLPLEHQSAWLLQLVVSRVRKLSRIQKIDLNSVFRVGVQRLPLIVYLYNLERKLNLYTSPNIEQLLGFTPEQMRKFGPRILSIMTYPEDRPRIMAFFDEIREGKKTYYEIKYRFVDAEGNVRWLFTRETVVEVTNAGEHILLAVTEELPEQQSGLIQLSPAEYAHFAQQAEADFNKYGIA